MALVTRDQDPVVAPAPADNQVDAQGIVSRNAEARRIVEAHQAALTSRRERDLISEKLLLHIDGSGDYQWYDIFNGQRTEIPRLVSEYRKTENLLRLVVDNAIAHHTTMPLRYFAESQADRDSQDKALMDALWMNFLAHKQDLNALYAEALYMAMPCGFCPVHRYWRDDDVDGYEPTPTDPNMAQMGEMDPMAGMFAPKPGMIDCWVGNPFDTVFDRGAKKRSVYWCSYGRVLPADVVRRAFAHLPEAAGLEGTNKIPSVAAFHRIARDWRSEGIGIHGSPDIGYRRETEGDQELLTLVCREVLPGVEANWQAGRLQLVAVPGDADLRQRQTSSPPVLLVDQPLPAKDFSWTLFYSHHRGDDVHGKPWVEDIDQLQVDLNIALSKRWELINRMMNAPIVAPGGALSEDMLDIDGYNVIEIDPALANWRPRVMEWSTEVLAALDREISEKRGAIYTGGGYQAASRGEAPGSRMAYRAIVALQQADNTIHGPVNERFRRSAVDFAKGCWRQMKSYGDVPWLATIVGDEYAHLVEPYIDATKLSDAVPQYKLVNAFGPSPELRAQEVLELMAMRGADGQIFLSTEEARRRYPDQTLFDTEGRPAAVAKRRAKAIATAFHQITRQFRQETGFQETKISHPWVQQAAMYVFQYIEQEYPRLQDDDLISHLATLSEITQDETADPVARLAAMQRQQLYYQWQAQMAAQGMPAQGMGMGAVPQALGPSTVQSVAAETAATGGGTMLDSGTGGQGAAQQ